MTTLRLCAIKSLKVAQRLNPQHKCSLQVRYNHVLSSKYLIRLIQDPSPKVLCSPRYSLPYNLSFASEHTSPALNASHGSQTVNIPDTVITSTGLSVTESQVLDPSTLPAVPLPLEEASVLVADPIPSSIGLGSWYPSGIVQQILIFFHDEVGLPWWAAIVGLTAALRILMLPFIIRMRRDTVNYINNMPEFNRLQMKLTEARKTGNYYDSAMCAQELTNYIQEKKFLSLGMFLPYAIQFPVFLSVFLALKGMSNATELKSFQTGGLFWFSDLSVPDQFYILPILTSVTIWAVIKYGKAGVTPMRTSNDYLMRQFVALGIPSFVFVFTMNFPAAVSCYWVTANLIVLIQTFILNFESVRKYFNIPAEVSRDILYAGMKKEGFIQGFKNSIQNISITNEISNREQLNAIKFEEAGKAPIQRTFKHNPMKPMPAPQNNMKMATKK